MRPTTVLAHAVGAVLICGALVGCGSDAPEPLDPTSATLAPSESVPSSDPTPSTPTPSNPGARARPVTVQGTVSALQGGCLLFTPGDMAESWVLVGKTAGLRPGDRVELQGVMIDTEQEGCPQGLPFDVRRFKRLG